MRKILAFILGSTLFFIAAVVQAAPAALVEEVAGLTSVRPFDYLNEGKVIDLGEKGSISIGYLTSCVHEEIKGGVVTVGAKESQVKNGKVTRNKVACDGGRLVLAANQAVQSGATAMRSVNLKPPEPKVEVYDVSPLITLPKSGRVEIRRVDLAGERYELDSAVEIGTRAKVDLASEKIALAPGGIYLVSVRGFSQVFKVAAEARQGDVPLLGRIVPF